MSTIDKPERAIGCPVVHFEIAPPRPSGFYLAQAQDLRDQGAMLFNTLAQGFWVVTSNDLVRDVYQQTENFSTESITPWNPDPHFRWIPLSIDPPDHAAFRRLLNRWFSPAAVRSNVEHQRAVCRRYIEELAPRGRCDAVAEFAIRYPTEVFLSLMNFPTADTLSLVRMVEDFFQGYSGLAPEKAGQAYQEIKEYCTDKVMDRRARPLDPDVDILSFLMQSEVALESEGWVSRPLTDDEVLDTAFMLVIGGLDTTKAQIGWMLYHFAVHPGDRQRLLDDPSLVDSAVEEVLRYYAIIYGDGRKVTHDLEFNGCELRKGDMIYAMTSAANRDPMYSDPDRFAIDRNPKFNMAFGTGPHRCLGAHLAKSELVIALEEWLRVIPHYGLETEEPLVERGAQLSLMSLPLVWATG